MCLQLDSSVHIIRGKGPDRQTALSSVCRRVALESRSRLAPATTPCHGLSGPDVAQTAATLSRARPQRVLVLLQSPGLWFTPPPSPSAALGPGLPAGPLSQPH